MLSKSCGRGAAIASAKESCRREMPSWRACSALPRRINGTPQRSVIGTRGAAKWMSSSGERSFSRMSRASGRPASSRDR